MSSRDEIDFLVKIEHRELENEFYFVKRNILLFLIVYFLKIKCNIFNVINILLQ